MFNNIPPREKGPLYEEAVWYPNKEGKNTEGIIVVFDEGDFPSNALLVDKETKEIVDIGALQYSKGLERGPARVLSYHSRESEGPTIILSVEPLSAAGQSGM